MPTRSQLNSSVIGKRAGHFSAGQLVLLVIILASTTLVLIYLGGLRDNFDAIADKSCAAQIREADRRNVWAGREYAMEIDECQTASLAIDSANPDTVKRAVADEMLRCWDQWGRGELDLFKSDGDYCYACSIVSFDKDIGEIPDMQQFMQNTKTVTGETYLERLAPAVRDTDQEINPPVFTLRTDTDYRVMLWYSRQREDGFRKRMYDIVGWDITPSQVGVISGGTTLLIGTTIEIVKTANLLAVFTLPQRLVKVGTAAGVVGVGGYAYARSSEGWYSLSAIYLTPNDPAGYYARQCDQMASIPTSP